MVFENPKDINFDNIEENFMKIFKKSNYRNREEDIKDISLNRDDSNMKIYLKE